jgi:hypothetical protein
VTDARRTPPSSPSGVDVRNAASRNAAHEPSASAEARMDNALRNCA